MSIIPHTKKQWLIAAAVLLVLLITGAAIFIGIGLWHSGYTTVEDSFFYSPFITDKTVLVFVAHQDDDMNLAYGVIDAFTQAGSDVIVAFSTNGDGSGSAEVRTAEAVKAEALMGVSKENIVLLGYGDHLVPPFFLSEPDLVRRSDAGYTQTYGADGIEDYHSLRFGEAAAYTLANYEADIRSLILNLRPDIIFVSDTDDNIDHVSVSQSFDRVMGGILREDRGYQPVVFKGFCYEYAWHGNEDFYHFVTLQSAKPSWMKTSYHTAYAWPERVRFPLPNAYLGYTLRSSRLRDLVLAYGSQHAVLQQNGLANGDRVFWTRRTDALWADVTASSGNAALLQDFIIGDTVEAPLQTCWTPDSGDTQPEIRFTWAKPQNVEELVFYDAPAPAGDILKVRITDDGGNSQIYTLPNGDGEPCRLTLSGLPVLSLTIEILASEGETIGFSEIEILPARDLTAQWIHLMDSDMNFLYEYACPANQEMELLLYGYPALPAEATVYITKDGSDDIVAEIRLDGQSFRVPPLEKGRYRVVADGSGCSTEIVLRVGDSMLRERLLRWIERKGEGFLPE